jgi:hypothetical protein
MRVFDHLLNNPTYHQFSYKQYYTEQFYQENITTIQPYTNKDIIISIDKLNTGKSPNEFGLAAEHLKY